MNIRITWENNTTLRYDFSEIWSWEDLFKAQLLAQGMIEQQAVHPVGVILNIPHNIIVPPQAVANTHQLLERLHAMVDVIVVVGGNTIVRALVNVVNRTHWRDSNRAVYITDNLEEARLLISQKRDKKANNGS